MPVKTGESIEIFIEEQAFSSSYDLAHLLPPLHISRQQVFSLSQSSCMSPVELTGGRRGNRGWERSQFIRESLVLYKLFYTL